MTDDRVLNYVFKPWFLALTVIDKIIILTFHSNEKRKQQNKEKKKKAPLNHILIYN